jgi:SAM-dependent methyltransferase
VRSFLLDAPLDLEGWGLTEVSLEAPAGGGLRIDVEAGNAVIEVKKSLASPLALEAARKQLARYVCARTADLGRRYVGILTDGRTWRLHHLLLDGSLVQSAEFVLAGPNDAGRLSAWLESVLATVQHLKPTPYEVLRSLGADSPACVMDLDQLLDLYLACKDTPEVQLKRELWGRLLIAALGTNFEDSDELFVTHTYLVLTAELIAYAIARVPVDELQDVRALLEGQQFQLAGLHGVVEADFFDWPALRPEGERIVRSIARRLRRFDWSTVEHDILKALYESVIDAETRHKLGEYYTPDWLAQRMVEEHIPDPLNEGVLDPACGSGTFLFWAVRHVLRAADEAGLSNQEALDLVVKNVSGIDLHPVVVTLARVTYLLAIGHDRLADRGELTIPVFLGDSVRWDHDADLFQTDGITISTSESIELFAQELHFPESVLEDPRRFDRLVAALASRAASRPAASSKKASTQLKTSIVGLMNAHQVADVDRQAVELVFEKLCRLHDAGRDHVWGYYIRNLARPLSFTRPGAQADALVGNPPWLAYRHMSKDLQTRYQQLAKARGLWSGGKVATHQDLSDLFVARAIEQYLRPGGRFAFVMPFGVLSRRQFAGFRTGDFTSNAEGVQAVAFDRPEEFARVKPPPFPMPACVVSGTRTDRPRPMPSDALRWTGHVENHHLGWEAASESLHSQSVAVRRAHDAHESPYRARFQQGATVVPRVLLTVQESAVSAVGLPVGRVAVRSRRSAVEKTPWKHLKDLTGVVEEMFVRPMHLGATIVAYRARAPWLAVVPYDGTRLLCGDDAALDEYPGLAEWWRRAEKLWEAHKTATNRLALLHQLDYMGKLHKQMPVPQHRVVYTKSGQHLAACRIDDASAIIDHTLYWAAVSTAAEAQYLAAILNSDAVSVGVTSLQARGQHNPRHFDMHVFALGFPIFDADNALHRHLVALAARAEEVSASVALSTTWQFQKCRHVTREALYEAGIAADIDEAVRALLAGSGRRVKRGETRSDLATPDLMGKLSLATHAAERPAKRRTKRAKHVSAAPTAKERRLPKQSGTK